MKKLALSKLQHDFIFAMRNGRGEQRISLKNILKENPETVV